MKVIKPNGTIVTVNKVEAFAEKLISFNGETLKYANEAKNIDNANALVFCIDTNNGIGLYVNAFTLGNLTQEQVKKLLKEIAKTDYLDLTEIELQEDSKELFGSRYIIDDGVSKPYFSNFVETSRCIMGGPPLLEEHCGITQEEAYDLAGVNPNGYSDFEDEEDYFEEEADDSEFGSDDDEYDYD